MIVDALQFVCKFHASVILKQVVGEGAPDGSLDEHQNGIDGICGTDDIETAFLQSKLERLQLCLIVVNTQDQRRRTQLVSHNAVLNPRTVNTDIAVAKRTEVQRRAILGQSKEGQARRFPPECFSGPACGQASTLNGGLEIHKSTYVILR